MKYVKKVLQYLRPDSPFKTDYTQDELYFYTAGIAVCLLVLFVIGVL